MSADLSPAAIAAARRGRFGDPLRYLETTASTNADALRWAGGGAPEGAVVVAEHQTHGRGRWGRGWFDAPGAGLLFSVVLRPAAPADDLGLVTTAAGVACRRALEAATGLRPALKWPNDVTVGGRKIAGILVETRAAGGVVEAAAVGMGINVGSLATAPEEVAARATSVADEGAEVERADLLADVLEALEDPYAAALDPARRGALVREAAAHSEILGRPVAVRLPGGETRRGTAARLLDDGALELVTVDGSLRIGSGEVERVRAE